ncbi:hypothetical protein [Hoeflea marina]|uniref:hypothetical protein n=1 Tax=Hoeflea marina TaxID=274592 RepID=UPI000D7194A7|nr:hypothetical protein [Hoeflea marina]
MRDLVRGLRQKTSLPRAILAPALAFLPGPLRDALKDMGQAGRSSWPASLKGRAPERTVILRSAAALRGADASALDIAAAAHFCTRVLLDAVQKSDLLVSETMLAMCWHDAEPQPFRAAALLHALFDRAPFGVAPGLVQSGDDLSSDERLRICVAVMVWLLADHQEDGISEAELVKIAGWLAADCLAACQSHWRDQQKLESVLLATAERI